MLSSNTYFVKNYEYVILIYHRFNTETSRLRFDTETSRPRYNTKTPRPYGIDFKNILNVSH